MIRQAVQVDTEAVRQVTEAAYAPWRGRLPDLPDVSGGLEHDILLGRVWVAEVEGRIAGCLIGGVTEDTWHLANIAVHPDNGGRGLGRALLDFAAEQARDAGTARMALATHRDMPRNVGMYERLGWQVTGREGSRVFMEHCLSL